MAENRDRPIAREPWQRLLQDRADAPPETTDARIRAAARRPLARRPARWWLPASLAASFVLAFVLVQLQFGEPRAPAIVTESDVAIPDPAAAQEEPARDASADAYTLPEHRDQRAPTGEILNAAPPPPMIDMPEAPRAESPSTGIWAGSHSQSARAPEVERSAERETAAAEAKTDGNDSTSEDLSKVIVTGSRKRDDANMRSSGVVSGLTSLDVTVAKHRTPEAWYAAIEALRAEGRTEEAERERELLDEAHPGWLKRHRAEQERKLDQERR